MQSVRYDGSLTSFLARYDVFQTSKYRQSLKNTSTEDMMFIFGSFDIDWGYSSEDYI